VSVSCGQAGAGAQYDCGMDTESRYRIFRQLHESGCFVMPNPWDLGSARILAGLGFKALATTSAGFAWSVGRYDNGVSLDQALAHLSAMAAAVGLPLNADFEGGFAVEPEGVAANVSRAVATGIAGLSIEDSTGNPDGRAHPRRAARHRR
jgi:2-methylisocitrate lyase-like PEP mutase family enzyme